jgi:hypothetical protein
VVTFTVEEVKDGTVLVSTFEVLLVVWIVVEVLCSKRVVVRESMEEVTVTLMVVEKQQKQFIEKP